MTDSPRNTPERPAPEARRRRGSRRLDTDVPYASPFTVMGRLRSFKHAVMGVWLVLRSQHNAWLHATATVLALVLAGVLHVTSRPLSLGEWADLVLAIVLVWVAETFNTGLEVMADGLVHERHPVIKIAKDVAAAAVLLAAVGAVVVGAILFIPRLVLVVEQWLEVW